jgi:predicted hydrocarbon binding protein
MGCSQEPFIEHYKSLLETVASNGSDRVYFTETLLFALHFGFEAYGINNAPVVKLIGNDIGKRLSSNFEAETLDELLIEVASFLELHENCRVSVLLKNGSSLKIEDDFKARLMHVIGKPFCTLKEGIIEGILKEKFGVCSVIETECYGTGHDHCLFKITL